MLRLLLFPVAHDQRAFSAGKVTGLQAPSYCNSRAGGGCSASFRSRETNLMDCFFYL